MAVQTATIVHHLEAMRATYTGRVQESLDISNEVAAELAMIDGGALEALRDRLGCTVHLRGNHLTLEGEEQQIANARAVIGELVELVEGGHQIGGHTVDAVLGTLEAGKCADLAIWDVAEPVDLVYTIGAIPLAASLRGGVPLTDPASLFAAA